MEWTKEKLPPSPTAVTPGVKTETLLWSKRLSFKIWLPVQQHVSISRNKGIGKAKAEVLHCVT